MSDSLTSPKYSTSFDALPAKPATLRTSVVRPSPPQAKKDWRFWGVFLALMAASFASAIEFVSVSTALPDITHELHGYQFVWVGSAYILAATAFLPLSGDLSQVFGRRPIMLASLFFFILGSILCGAATSMNFLITGRAVQGLGGGGIIALTEIIVSDMVALRERGTYRGIILVAWAVASFIAPIIGGSLAEKGEWRWLFYLNIFTSGLAAVLVIYFLRLKTPEGTIRERLKRIDWLGNALVIASTTSCVIALTWGGVQYPWSSARVLTPLIVGFFGLACFFIYEMKFAAYPIVPFTLMSTLTGLSGYIQTFLGAVLMLAVVYYTPVYFQGCKGASPIAAGVDLFGLAFIIAPVCVVAGVSVAVTKRYRPQLWLGWCIMIVGSYLFSTLKPESSRASALGFEIVTGIGLGIVYSVTFFPVLAPLPVKENAHALALFTFIRSFGQIWGVTIGSTIIQGYLATHLPPEFVAQFPQGTEIAYSTIPLINKLEPVLAAQIRTAFAGGLKRFWEVMTGIGGAGLVVSLAMKHLTLHTMKDEDWGIEQQPSAHSDERRGCAKEEVDVKVEQLEP
ncbi:hypothetical protein AMATHDRAFT_148324 [Amanita thiersii Skay4041]|uniref:Major facilitator superfamily (MFS) profile domain-containing protein n=1 Tax=Amanita thiersii Skay4041 TaxID=703135 RepID=A0A2A9NN75_9AGAR|nr:hypothetical protein AMATHDRAFT_148324 [Amanita thiersii Skay4041]